MTSRIFSAVLAGQMLLLTGCTGGGPSLASPSVEGLPTPTSANPTESTPPSADRTEPGPDSSVTPSADPDEQALLDRVRAEGTLSVIVEVNLDGTARLNTAQRRQLVAEAQDGLIAELDPAHASVTTRFKHNPQLTLTVDEDGLLALFASSRVARVWANESIPLD